MSVGSLCTLLFIAISAGSAQAFEGSGDPTQDDAPFLRSDKRVTATLDVLGESWETYRIEVTDDAIEIDIQVDESIGDVDIFLRHELPMETWDEADFTSEDTANNEHFEISRWYDEFPSGTYYVDIAFRGNRAPRVDGQRTEQFEVGVTYRMITAEDGKELSDNKPARVTMDPDDGGVAYFYVDVPDDAECLRFDILKSSHPLDLYLSPFAPVNDPYRAEFFNDSSASKKTLLIEEDGDPSLRAGRYYLAVHDPFGLDANFTLRTSFTPDAPETAEIPSIETPSDPLQRAYSATVMLMPKDGTGSGSILSPEGLILTNYHVVEETALGEVPEDEELIVGITTDPTNPVNELFRAKTLHVDKKHDLALVKIVSGIYGQPLPDDFRLPYLEIADELPPLGEELRMIGYPSIGSSTTGCYVTLTLGVVSGFDRGPEGFMIKTDADIAGGNSGGTAVDENYELIGVPTQSQYEEDSNGQVGFLIPVGSIPESWRTEIQESIDRSIGSQEESLDDE